MIRKQFTFYESFAASIFRIRKNSDRLAVYDAIVRYAIYGEMPDLEEISDIAAVTFSLIQPILDTAKRRSESGAIGGSKTQANARQTASEKEAEIESEAETEAEAETEKENESECSSQDERGRRADAYAILP